MPVLSCLFTNQELLPVTEGIHKFIRLLGLIHDPDPLVMKWYVDEFDLKSTLRSVAERFAHSEDMIGQRKYQGIDFDAPNEVKKDMYTFLLTGRTEPEEAHNRKCNLPMYYAVIVPVCNLFYKYDHRMQIDIAQAVVTALCTLIDNTTSYGSYAEALEAKVQIRSLINAHEEQRKAAKARAGRQDKRQKIQLAVIPELEEVDQGDNRCHYEEVEDENEGLAELV